jgi:hypothetical protein
MRSQRLKLLVMTQVSRFQAPLIVPTAAHMALVCFSHMLTLLLRRPFLSPSHRRSRDKWHPRCVKDKQRQAQVGSWRA